MALWAIGYGQWVNQQTSKGGLLIFCQSKDRLLKTIRDN